jgi:hypothetical protein
MLKSHTRGYYTPSFYKLVVNTIYNLSDLQKLEKQRLPFSTFFHEYLHFLQDISTSFGLMNGSIILNEIKYFNAHARNQNTTFNLPIPLNSNSSVDTSRQMRIIYMGPVKSGNIDKISNVKKVESSVIIPHPFNKKLEKVVINLELKDGSFKEIDFGGIALIESMAHIAQTHYYPEVDHDAIPYKLAQLVVNHIYPEFAKNPLYVFALCDACLMTYHPGLTFFEFLNGIKNEGKLPSSEEEVYELVYSTITGNGKNILELFEELSNKAQEEFTHYFTTDLHTNEKEWIKTVLERAKQLRLNQPTFLLDLLKQEKANSEQFRNIILELGSPLIQNIDSESHMFTPRGFEKISLRIDVFSSINEIFKVFDTGKSGCGLIDYCKNSEKGNITDNRCVHEPWKRSTDIETCGFGILWKIWGLQQCKLNPIKT